MDDESLTVSQFLEIGSSPFLFLGDLGRGSPIRLTLTMPLKALMPLETTPKHFYRESSAST